MTDDRMRVLVACDKFKGSLTVTDGAGGDRTHRGGAA